MPAPARTTTRAAAMPRAIFLPRDFLRAALARARLSVAAKFWEPPAAERGSRSARSRCPSKEERARAARGVRETSAWALARTGGLGAWCCGRRSLRGGSGNRGVPAWSRGGRVGRPGARCRS